MTFHGRRITILAIGSAILSTIMPVCSLGQETSGDSRPSASVVSTDDVKALGQLVRQLQSQVQGLNARVRTLEANEVAARDESARLRAQLAGKVAASSPTARSGTSAGQSYAITGNALDASAQVVAFQRLQRSPRATAFRPQVFFKRRDPRG